MSWPARLQRVSVSLSIGQGPRGRAAGRATGRVATFRQAQ